MSENECELCLGAQAISIMPTRMTTKIENFFIIHLINCEKNIYPAKMTVNAKGILVNTSVKCV